MKTLTRKDLSQKLIELDACAEAREWARTAKGTTAQLYARCKRGDWLLWLAATAGVDRRVVTLAACAVARSTLKHVPAGELRPLRAIEAAEAWARGVEGASLEKVQEAAYAASNASSAAYAASYAASYAAYSAEKSASLAQSAAIVRQFITWKMMVQAMKS
jgi:hypothetical protein